MKLRVYQQAGKLLAILGLCSSYHSYGQESPGASSVPVVMAPAPNAAALGKYGDIPVSTYTGLPSISVPLYSIQTKSHQVDISLNYHASGIRVEEEASVVGLGWVLNAGGVITRSVRGDDDFSGAPQGAP